MPSGIQLTISISQLLSHVLKNTINITNFLCSQTPENVFQLTQENKTIFQEMLFLENDSNCLNFLQFSRKPKTVTFGKYLVSLIGDFFAFIESVRLLLLPLSLSRIGWNLGFFTRRFGIEETRVVRRRRNPKPGVWAVQCSNRVDENRVRVFEPVDTGIKERW